MCGTRRSLPLLIILLASSGLIQHTLHSQSAADGAGRKIAEGYRALEAGDLGLANTAFSEALESAPDAVPALLGLAEIHELQGDPLLALQLARRAATLAPNSPAPAMAEARLLAAFGAFDNALEAAERVLSFDPGATQGYLLSALLLRDLGRRDEAISRLAQALENNLRDPHLEAELAMLLIAADRPADAGRRAQEGLTTHGDTGGLHLALGLALAQDETAESADAISHLERALDVGVPDPGRVQLELGSLLLEASRPAEAIEYLEQAAASMPDAPDAHYKLGVAKRTTGDTEGARQSLTRFQELKDEAEQRERRELEAGTALNAAQALATENRLPEALESIDAILSEHPTEGRAHTLRAKILYSLGRAGEALDAIERARALDPSQIEPNYLEGMFLLRLDRPGQARTALLRAIALDPGLAEAYELLGGAAAKMNDPAAAADYFARALELGADSPSLRLGYGAALETLGRLEESAEQEEAYRRLVQRPQ